MPLIPISTGAGSNLSTPPEDITSVNRTKGTLVLMGFVNSGSSSDAQRRMTTGGLGRKSFRAHRFTEPTTFIIKPSS